MKYCCVFINVVAEVKRPKNETKALTKFCTKKIIIS